MVVKDNHRSEAHNPAQEPLTGNGFSHLIEENSNIRYALDQHSIVAITDQRGIITYVNDRFCEISGYSREELIGQDHRIVNSGYHSKEFIRDLWVTIANGRVWKGDICNRAKDGSIYWVETSIVPILNEHGKPYQYIAIRTDITEMKLAQLEVESLASELQTVAEVSTAVATELDLDALLQNTVDKTRADFGLYHTHIYLLDEAGENLVLAAGAGDAGRVMQSRGHSIPISRRYSLVARCARSRQAVIANDVTQELDFLPNPLLPETRAEMAVPMVVGDTLIGVLDVQSERVGRFREKDVRVQTTLASQIAVAVQNARAYQAEEENLIIAEQLAMINAALPQAQNEDDILAAVAQYARQTNPSTISLSYVETDEMGQPEISTMVAAWDSNGPSVDSPLLNVPLQMSSFPITKLWFSDPSAIMIVEDAANDPRVNEDLMRVLQMSNTQAFISIPLYAGGRWQGQVSISWAQPHVLTEQERKIYSALPQSIAGVVASRRAYLDEQRAETEAQTLAADLQTVAEVSTAVATELDLDALLQNTVDKTRADFGLYHTHIYLLDEAGENLVLAAGAGDAGRVMQSRGHSIPISRRYSLVARCARSRQAVIANDVTQELDFLPNPLLPETRAEMAVPMVVGDTLIGVLDVQSERVGRFREKDVRVQTTLASQIAVAVQNARAFAESQALSAEMLQQAEQKAELERQTADRLRQVDLMKSQFLANMSHELRTPLNSIIGYSEVLLDGDDGDLTEEAVEDVQTIYNSGQHLLAIINDILDLAKIEAGEMKMDRRPTELDTVVSNVVHAAQVLIKEKPVTLRFVENAKVPLVLADALRLRQITTNLVSNAVKFTERGSVTVSVGQLNDHEAYVKVEDTGIGIAPDHIDMIFDQFRQVDGSSTRRAGGTGLGLTITRHLVHLQGGEIHVESQVGQGSTFWFTLPLAETALA